MSTTCQLINLQFPIGTGLPGYDCQGCQDNHGYHGCQVYHKFHGCQWSKCSVQIVSKMSTRSDVFDLITWENMKSRDDWNYVGDKQLSKSLT